MFFGHLLKAQAELDQSLLKQIKISETDRLDCTIMDMHVKLGKLANAWRGYRYWDDDRKPRTDVRVFETGKGWHQRNILLERYIDCFAGVLSICLQLRLDEKWNHELKLTSSPATSIIRQFTDIIFLLDPLMVTEIGWYELADRFLLLGGMLGFNWLEIQKSYYSINGFQYDDVKKSSN